MWFTSSGTGEWPTGIHWTPGERKFVPDDYPKEGEPPAFLTPDPGPAKEG